MSAQAAQKRSALQGVRVVNTRSRRQAGALDALLEERGARPLSYPCIDIAPAFDPTLLDTALKRAAEGAFDWLVLTSANAVEAVQAGFDRLGLRSDSVAGTRVAAVGPGTTEVVADRLGLPVDLSPEEYTAEALAERLVGQGAKKVLVPQAEKARETLGRVLGANGIEVEAVVAYRTVLGGGGVDLPRLARDGEVDAVAFASPSAVDNLAARFEQENGEWSDLQKLCVACIGPITQAAAERRGLEVRVAPREHTIPDLVDSLESYYQANRRSGEAAT